MCSMVTDPELVFQSEAIGSTRQSLVQKGDQREKHFRRNELVDVTKLFEADHFG